MNLFHRMKTKSLSIILIFLVHIRNYAFALDFGICEVIIPQLVVTNLSTPYWINKSIQGCCKGFIKKADKCEPDCGRVNCVNSYCIGNNTCQCNTGYHKISEYNCMPTCDHPCGVNMECSEPNHCTCKRDYKKTNETHCEPICSFTEEDFDCINAYCYAPSKCRCHEGFKQISEFECEAMCNNCRNGNCVGPNNCECNEGYEKNSNGTCMPQCVPACINGNCVKPNLCQCHENFKKYLIPNECFEANVIKDLRDCRRTCTNGSCNKNATCICNYGYEMYNGKCSKICHKNCINGKCLEDQCVCPPDYKLSIETSTCMPICSFEDGHDCINGDCIGPNICECYPGYKFLDNRNCTCVAMCDPPCMNGVCTTDGCICHENFYMIADNECIKNCSEGYMWLHDDCVENFDFNNFDDESTTEMITSTMIETTTEVVTETTKVETTTMLETTTEEEVTISDIFEESTRHLVMAEKPVEPEISTVLIVVLSSIAFLLICILIAFYVLYSYVFPKHIYFVQEKEQSTNCVYFTKQQDRHPSVPVTEFNI
ncbi:hypothetical protein ACKWTF_001485 [Chironomus riparius]